MRQMALAFISRIGLCPAWAIAKWLYRTKQQILLAAGIGWPGKVQGPGRCTILCPSAFKCRRLIRHDALTDRPPADVPSESPGSRDPMRVQLRPQSFEPHNWPSPNGRGFIVTNVNDRPALIGDFSTPDVFADDALTFERTNDTIRITFGVARMESPMVGTETALVAVGRLILPVSSAQRLSLGLHDYLVNQGLDPTSLFGEGVTAQ